MQPLKTTRNEFSTPNLVEIVELNTFSIIFGSKVINVTFVSGGHLGNMQIMPISALRDNASNQNSQKWVLHPKISGIGHAERIYIIFGSKAINVTFVTGGHLGNIYHYIFDTFTTFTCYISIYMHITSIYMGTYLYYTWWVNFPWGGSIFYYRKVTRGSVFYGVNILSDTG